MECGRKVNRKKNLCEQWKYLMDEESTFGFYDSDSSEYVWKTTEVYRKLYMGDASHWMFWDMFNFEKLKHEKTDWLPAPKGAMNGAIKRFLALKRQKNGESGHGDVVEYMQLAEEYWKNKHDFISHK